MKTSAKTKLIIILASVMACMMVATFTACDGADGKSKATEGLEYYLLPDDTFGVKAGTTLYLDKVVVPAMYKGKAVTQILNSAFQSATNLKEILLPDTIKIIQDVAFNNCPALEKITIPNSVTSIGNNAFCYSGLTSVIIPDSVTTIGNNAFGSCNRLTSVTIGSGVTSISNDVFSACSELTSVIWNAEECIIVIQNSYNSLFDGCSKLTNINIGEHVKTIPSYAFQKCSGLTNITIPNSVTTIGDYAFSWCSGLTSITIPDSVTTIGNDAFFSSGLTSVTIPDSVTTIGNSAFAYCNELTSVTIGNGITSIGDYTFIGCGNLMSVTIGSGVTSIGNSAFNSCNKLIEVINNSNLNITKESFDNGRVGYYALSIKKGGTTDIVNKGGYLFYTYENVNYLLGSVGKNTELILPNDYNGMSYEIYERAFNFRSELTSVTIPNGVTSIGNIAFCVCRELTSITIPSSVTSIGDQAFDECGKLKTIYYASNKEQWSNISIGHSNYSLTSATRYYYSASKPTAEGNYWHYDTDGITPVIWKKD
ncbi:MAG: leucine-rich repeat domain-containing protein [Candidatus Borkfalkiaceae bacterium]|nr:leucine-rich repeat domain-containing protein [Christensenellaceae bacterium]